MSGHDARIAAIVSGLESALARVRARLASADAAAAERQPAEGGWSAAQVAAHLAATHVSFASIIDGTFPLAKPAADGFVERGWEEIGARIPARAQAPSRVHPPAGVTRDEALASFDAAAARLIAALRGLDPERARWTIESPIVGCVSVYQVGEWATAHLVRHNKQMKRLLDVG